MSLHENIHLAYDLPTVEFHNELYVYIQKIEQKFIIEELEDYLASYANC